MPKTLDKIDKKVTGWKRSLSFKVNSILLFCFLIIMAVYGIINILSERDRRIKEIIDNSNQIAARIAFDYSASIESHNFSILKSRIFLEMNNKDVLAILIHIPALSSAGIEEPSDTGYIRINDLRIAEFKWSEAVREKLKNSLFNIKKDILGSSSIGNAGIIGRIEIYGNGYYFNRDIISLIISVITQSLLLSFFILLVIYYILKKTVVNPVAGLNKVIISFTDKNFSIRSDMSSKNEIGILSENINQMADSLQNYNNEISRQLLTDSLTDLPNRLKILIDIENTDCPTLVLINIDFFKEINDFYGNNIGDLVLKEAAYRLRLLQDDYKYKLYRMPADEFAILFDREMDIEELENIVMNISEKVNDQPFILNNNEINVRVTFGAARSYEIGRDKIEEKKWSNIATSADMALKKAKKLQKNFIIYKESMEISKEYESNILWKNKLKEAIKNNRIIPFFQPIVNNISRKPEKYESLVRLIDSKGNIVTPHYFLEIAKKSHLYGEITKVMLDRTISVIRNSEYEFSMNLTIHDILDEEMNIYIKSMIKKNINIAGQLVFEILESEGIENYKEVMLFIEEIKELGCKIAIDDFGSGYSNFEHILRLSVDYIKIDASLIKNIDIDPNAQVIAKTIANFSKELGLKTISEFVHSRSVYEKGRELGIDFSQGYYFGEPREFIIK